MLSLFGAFFLAACSLEGRIKSVIDRERSAVYWNLKDNVRYAFKGNGSEGICNIYMRSTVRDCYAVSIRRALPQLNIRRIVECLRIDHWYGRNI